MRAEFLSLHPQNALIPGGRDFHIAAGNDQMIQAIHGETHDA
jgi:hypothetical protein